jgi:hypothetical protein
VHLAGAAALLRSLAGLELLLLLLLLADSRV